MRKLLLIPCGIIALSALVLYPALNTLADGDDDAPKVRSSKLKNNKCKTQNNFKTTDDVYAKGEHFLPSNSVDIYVALNQKWNVGDAIGSDVSGGKETVIIDSEGKIPCTKIWGSPLTAGKYDIVVDANQDGTYNSGDAIDGKSINPGFKVR